MSKVIQIDVHNTHCRIVDHLPFQVSKGIGDSLAYMPAFAQFTAAFKAGKRQNEGGKGGKGRKWNGLIYMWDWKQKKFPTGLMSRVRHTLKEYGYKVKIVDKRKKPKKNRNWSFKSERDDGKQIVPRYYQDEAIAQAKKIGRGIISHATGTGKTVTFTKLVAELSISPAVIFVPTKDLMYQTQREMQEMIVDEDGSPVEVGIIGDGNVDPKDITICIINSALYAYGLRFDNSKNKIVEDKRKRVVGDEKKEKETIVSRADDVKYLIENAKVIIADEVHRAATRLWQTPLDRAHDAYYRLGFSVHPDAYIDLRGDVFDDGWSGSIEEAFSILIDSGCQASIEDEYEIINVSDMNIYSRSLDNTGVVSWNKINKFIRHLYDGHLRDIHVGGDHLLMTPEHSAFIVDSDNSLLEVDARNVKKSDIMLKDLGNRWGHKDQSDYVLNLEDIIEKQDDYKHKIRVACTIPDTIRSDLGYNPKMWYQCRKRSIHGHNLSYPEYMQFKDRLSDIRYVYYEGSPSITNMTFNVSSIAYLLGFYLGDGWIDGNRLCFAVEESILDEFVNSINRISVFDANLSIRKMRGRSYEVKINSQMVVNIFKEIFGGIQKCYDKRIPNNLLNALSEQDKIELLRGLIDSDGYVNNNKGKRSRFVYCTVSKKLAYDILTLLKSIGLSPTLCERDPSPGGIVDGRRIIGSRKIYNINCAYVDGWRKDYSRFNNTYKALNVYVNSVNDIKYNGYVYDLEMEGHPSFFANGILVHNSATPYREDGCEMEIESLFGTIIHYFPMERAMEEGFLSRPDVLLIRYDYDPDGAYIKYSRDLEERAEEEGEWKHSSEWDYRETFNELVTFNEDLNEKIANIAYTFAKKKMSVLILVKEYPQGELITHYLGKLGVEEPIFLKGKDSSKVRNETIERVRNKDLLILTATTIADMGLDLPSLDVLVMASSGGSDPTKSPDYVKQEIVKGAWVKSEDTGDLRFGGVIEQRIGRVVRKHPGKKTPVVVDIWHGNKKMRKQASARRKVYKDRSLKAEFVEYDEFPFDNYEGY